MKGIKFDGKHSYTDYGMWLNSYEIGAAEPNLKLVTVPGMETPLDFTEYFGGVTYNSREIKMQFTFTADRFSLSAAYAALQNGINGRRVKIILDDDKDYYYSGRCSVGALQPDGQLGTVEVTAQCDPYRYKVKPKTATCSGDTLYNLGGYNKQIHATVKNLGEMPVLPVFRASKPFCVSLTEEISGGSTKETYVNASKLAAADKDVQFRQCLVAPGATQIFGFCADGELTVTVTWQERSL